jgi:phosphohistidine swiveling domain-containing protein
MAISAQIHRELARDVTLRFTHELRMALREMGTRRVSEELIDNADDVFYLTCDELLAMPVDARLRIKRRRAERERLQAVRVPAFIDRTWVPLGGSELAGVGDQLGGIGASHGVAEGRVRVVYSPECAGLQPDEVLVAPVADAGFTALFGVASAVVTDIGSGSSDAAVVARQLDLPCVVNTADASTRLTDGMLVRVDGTAGTVTVLAAADPLADDLASHTRS